MKVKIEDIKSLRDLTGAGIADCRRVLEETGGDMEKSIKSLRDLGMERADKKAEREVKAGAVFSYVHHTQRLGTMVALACETDFVAKTEEFQKLGKELAIQAASTKPENVEELLKQEYVRDMSKKVGELVKETIGKLGENIRVVEFKVVNV